MLIGNYSVLQKGPGGFIAGSTTSVEGQVRSNFSKSGSYRNRFYVDQTTVALSLYAIPTGSYPDIAWVLPQISGQIASTQPIQGAGSATVTLAGGLNADASLTGAGDITSAIAQLIISMVANLAGDGTVSTADLRGFLQAVANLSGSGDLTATAAALAWMQAATDGSGTITNATPYAQGNLSADILSYGSLTPEGIRDAVWNALSANYGTAGSMGQLLASAGAAGDPLLGVVEGALTLKDVLRILLAVQAGDASGLEGAEMSFKSLDGLKNRVVASYSAGERNVGTLDVS
jgi:hypothetical protein